MCQNVNLAIHMGLSLVIQLSHALIRGSCGCVGLEGLHRVLQLGEIPWEDHMWGHTASLYVAEKVRTGPSLSGCRIQPSCCQQLLLSWASGITAMPCRHLPNACSEQAEPLQVVKADRKQTALLTALKTEQKEKETLQCFGGKLQNK